MTIRPDKEVKRWFKGIASAHPDDYYATAILHREGFIRKHCACGTFFWTVHENQETCGDPTCSGGFRLFENNPVKEPLTYVQVWQRFAKLLEERGYRTMPRYPVVARWNPTTDFTIASIAAFQPHVVNGEVEPPAKKLVIPQFCLRFGDIDNVGITGSHLTGFIMIGQHMFVPPEEWNQNEAFQDLYDWFTKGLGLPKNEITLHEDAWAGGGNFGPCMEFFSRGVELGNQVYMLYEQTPEGDKDLRLKVLDMGMGMERNAWFSQGKGTAYDATFPYVIKNILERIKHTPNRDLQQKFLPKASYLNIDEVENIGEAWSKVAKEIGTDVESLRKAIEPMQAVYSIAEHARSLLFAITDGGLPSNVGGGYNLRTIFRRAQGFIDRHAWNLDMGEIAKWHAQELKEIFPELLQGIEETAKVLAVEKRKHLENAKRANSIIDQEMKKAQKNENIIPLNRLLDLYDSDGISPDTIAKAGKEKGISVEVPDNFFQMVAERHEKSEQKTATRRLTHFPIEAVSKTEQKYFESYDLVEFSGTVTKIFDNNHVILNQTAFYPTSGGQEHDTGIVVGPNGVAQRVIDVIKQGNVIIHVLENAAEFEEGQTVRGKIDWSRRKQLAQHHTATHIINGASRKILGDHIWQAGAAKTEEKGRIDITHYELPTDEEIQRVEEEANRIVNANITVHSRIIPKKEAEEAHGFRLYQGGAVPGKDIRVVDIPGFDVEACGGTHLNKTGEAEIIKILKTSKIQDGIVRIEFVAGERAKQHIAQRQEIIGIVAKLLDTTEEMIPSSAQLLFDQWKAARKGKLAEFSPGESQPYKGDVLAKVAEILQTQQHNIPSTIERFQKDIVKAKNTNA